MRRATWIGAVSLAIGGFAAGFVGFSSWSRSPTPAHADDAARTTSLALVVSGGQTFARARIDSTAATDATVRIDTYVTFPGGQEADFGGGIGKRGGAGLFLGSDEAVLATPGTLVRVRFRAYDAFANNTFTYDRTVVIP